MSMFGNHRNRGVNYERMVPDGPAREYLRENVKLSPFSGKPTNLESAKRDAIALHNMLADSNQAALRGQPDPNLAAGSLARTQLPGVFDAPAQLAQNQGLARRNTNAEAQLAQIGAAQQRVREGGEQFGVKPFGTPIAPVVAPPPPPPPAAAPAATTADAPLVPLATGIVGSELPAVPPVAEIAPAAPPPPEPVAFDWETPAAARQRGMNRRRSIWGSDYDSDKGQLS